MTDSASARQFAFPGRFVAESASLTSATIIAFTEGPAVDAEGTVFFSDIWNSRIMKLTALGEQSVFRVDSGRTNGNTFDAQGWLISCEGSEMGAGGRRRVVRTDIKTDEMTVLTERYQGARYNSPNDVVVDSQERIYFTDPCYGDRSIMEMEVEGVYRIEPDGAVTRILQQPAIQRPNGLAITPDDTTLYLVDSNPNPGGNRKIWAFDLQADGTLTNQRLIFDFSPGRGGDGMRLDVEGNLWIAGGINRVRREGETTDNPAGVCIVSPAGKLLGHIPVPEDLVTNLAFGGPDKKTLYITAGKTLYRIQTRVAGWSIYPKL